MENKLNTENKPALIEDNVVVTMDYELTVDGEIVDSSTDGDPIVFLQGAEQIARGLEKAIYGLKEGDEKQVVVAPADGYGEYDPEALVEVARSEFPADFPLEPGLEITVHSDENDEELEDEMMEATVVEVGKFVVKLDFNHPLAGKTLNFKIKIVDLREATQEEIEHGHVHGDEDEDVFEFEDEDFDELEEE